MTKDQTIAVSGAVCLGLAGGGYLIEHRYHLPTLAAGVIAGGAYLAGTFGQNQSLFGAVARPLSRQESESFALTFDDGPDPRHTLAIGEILAERGHQATFFTLGQAVRSHPGLVRQLAAAGHEIACHGDDHRLLAFAAPKTVVAQILAWEHAVGTELGHPAARLFRAPHGVRSPWLVRVARRRGYAVCGWDGAVFDTAEPGVAVIAHRVIALLRPNAIVLLHDGDGSGRRTSRAQTVAAVAPVLDAAEARGLRCVTLGTLLGNGGPTAPSLRPKPTSLARTDNSVKAGVRCRGSL